MIFRECLTSLLLFAAASGYVHAAGSIRRDECTIRGHRLQA
jgi:hypothetical protein